MFEWGGTNNHYLKKSKCHRFHDHHIRETCSIFELAPPEPAFQYHQETLVYNREGDFCRTDIYGAVESMDLAGASTCVHEDSILERFHGFPSGANTEERGCKTGLLDPRRSYPNGPFKCCGVQAFAPRTMMETASVKPICYVLLLFPNQCGFLTEMRVLSPFCKYVYTLPVQLWIRNITPDCSMLVLYFWHTLEYTIRIWRVDTYSGILPRRY